MNFYYLIGKERVNFESLKEVALGEGSKDGDDRSESRVQITEIDTSKVVRPLLQKGGA